MFVVRAIRCLTVLVVTVAVIGLAATGPLYPMLFLAQPMNRVLGSLLVVGPLTALVWSTALTRSLLYTLMGNDLRPAHPERVEAIVRVAASTGATVPTLFVGPSGLSRPVSLRGLRHQFVIASADQQHEPERLLDQIAENRRRGDDRVVLLLAMTAWVHSSWIGVLRLVTRATRPGLSAFDRSRLMVLLLFVPLVAVGWILSWIAVQVVRAVAGSRVSRMLLDVQGFWIDIPSGARNEVRALGRGVRLRTMLALAEIEHGAPTGRRPRRWWNTPGALVSAGDASPLAAAVRIVIAVLVIGLGATASWGKYPAERIVWPGESPAVAATVREVTVEGDPTDSLLGRAGFEVGVDYQATVQTDDGRTMRLLAGTGRVEPGDRVEVVPVRAPEWDGAPWVGRSRTQDSVSSIVSLGLAYLLLAVGSQRVAGGGLDFVVLRAIAAADYDQRVLSGRRHRSRRPKTMLELDR